MIKVVEKLKNIYFDKTKFINNLSKSWILYKMANHISNILKQSCESGNLSNLLSSLSKELEVPYSVRRPKFDNDQLSLQDALIEIAQREKDLKAAIGISKMLLENVETCTNKISFLESENAKLKTATNKHDFETFQTNTLFSIETEEIQDLTDQLNNKEKEIKKLLKQNEKLVNEKKNFKSKNISIERFNSEIHELSLKFREEYELVYSKF